MPEFPEVEVAVALIADGDRILTVYSPEWGSFTLPMTKRRKWDDPKIPPAHREETWIDAAGRAAAESLGRTFIGLTELPLDPSAAPYHQSDRDGTWKRYEFKTFKLAVWSGESLLPGIVYEWLLVDEILDNDRRPLSPTARHLVRELQAQAKLDGHSFP
jgi:hypothetical protein